jgi:hypothetical protein
MRPQGEAWGPRWQSACWPLRVADTPTPSLVQLGNRCNSHDSKSRREANPHALGNEAPSPTAALRSDCSFGG